MQDAGITETAQTCMVMEYVNGVHLDAAARDERAMIDELVARESKRDDESVGR